jgi:uncharacterized membrane protein
LDVIAFVAREAEWAPRLHDAAGYVFLAGAIISLATALTGFADWLSMEPGTQVRRMANAHAVTMILMSLLVVADLAYRYVIYAEAETDLVLLVLGVGIAGLAALGGSIGGSMVYGLGFNVDSQTRPRP